MMRAVVAALVALGCGWARLAAARGEGLRYAARSECARQGEYYSVASLSCERCAADDTLLVPASDGFSCECSGASRVRHNGTRASCERCAAGALLSADRRACVARRCVQRGAGASCLVCGRNQISVTQNPDGSPLKEVKCVTCRAGYQPSRDRATCEPCALRSADTIGACACEKTEELTGEVCVPRSFVQNRDEYKAKPKSVWDHSLFLELLKLEFLCMKENATACQALAHLCVLSFYDADHTGPCRLWLRTSPPPGLPVLMHGENEAYSILNQKTVPASYRFTGDAQNSELQLVAAAYSLDGGAVQFLRPALEWGSLCPCAGAAPAAFKLGYNYRHRCRVTATEVVSQERAAVLAPYLLYRNSTNRTVEALSPVAVAIKIEDGDYMKSSDKKNLRLFHRYFLLNKWGHAAANRSERRAVLAWYLRSATLHIKVEYATEDHTNRIYTPLLMLEYGSIAPTDLSADTALTLSFTLLYEMGGNGFIHAMEISVGVLAGVATLLGLLRAWSLGRRSACSAAAAAAHLMVFVCGYLGDALYLVAFGATLHSLVMFRWQRVVYTLPPTRREELFVEAFVASALALKLVAVGRAVWRRSRADVFLLDWRTPLLRAGSLHYESEKERSWRKLLVARHWCRIQTERAVPVPAYVLAALAVMETLKAYDATLERASYRYACSAGVLACAYCCLLALRPCWRRLRVRRARLTDACAAADVSLLVFEEELHAHYVHGRCTGSAEGGEERGLLPGRPHQAFTILCDPNLRMIYNKLSEGITSSELQGGRNVKNSTPSTTNLTNKADSLESIDDFGSRTFRDPRAHYQALLTKFLASFIDQALEGCSWAVRERSAVERLFDVELSARAGPGALEGCSWAVRERSAVERLFDVELSARAGPGVSTLLRDVGADTHPYNACTWRGAEWSLATLDVFLFSLVELVSGNSLLAALLTLATWKLLQSVCQEAGRRSLVRSNLLDDTFLR